jgi:transposase
MMETERRRERRSMLPVHPDAAAIDIGATVHVAAVGPARDPEPVRSFGTFTGDLHRLTDWFAQCGIKTVVMESTGVYWIPIYEFSSSAASTFEQEVGLRRLQTCREEERGRGDKP